MKTKEDEKTNTKERKSRIFFQITMESENVKAPSTHSA
jgi:hypothetical protein